jgi:hypothetical protein
MSIERNIVNNVLDDIIRRAEIAAAKEGTAFASGRDNNAQEMWTTVNLTRDLAMASKTAWQRGISKDDMIAAFQYFLDVFEKRFPS